MLTELFASNAQTDNISGVFRIALNGVLLVDVVGVEAVVIVVKVVMLLLW